MSIVSQEFFGRSSIALLLVAIVCLTVVAFATHTQPQASNGKVIKIVAKQFDYTPAEITVKKGEPVTLEFTSADRVHGFGLPDFKLTARIEPGNVTRVTFTPDKTGEFGFACNIYCGSGHLGMTAKLIVTE